MKASEIVKEIEPILKEKGIKKAEFYKKSGISSASFSQWRHDIGFPQRLTLERINSVIGTNFSVESDAKEEPAAPKNAGLSEKDIRLLNWFRSLPEEKQKAILISQDAPEELL